MNLPPGSKVTRNSAGRERPERHASPLLAAVALTLFGLLAVAIVGARPMTAAAPKATPAPTPTPTQVPSPTESPSPTFVTGRHIYDNGGLLSTKSAATAEALAAHIEAGGGGRVVLYTIPDSAAMPRTLAEDWHVDGLLLTGQSTSFGELAVGATLKSRLTTEQQKVIGDNSSPGPQTMESWMLTTLARADAFVNHTHVFDGAGVLDATGRQRAEASATSLSKKIGAPVYIDIALGGQDPSSASFFNGADLSSGLRDALIVALGVSGTQIAGYLQTDNSALWDKYSAVSPWKSVDFGPVPAANGDVQAALLAAIDAVRSGSGDGVFSSSGGGIGGTGISGEALFWIIFTIAMVLIGVGSPFYGGWLIRRISGVSAPIKAGLPGNAIIESIADTGVTVTMPSTGPEAPEYKLGLQVTPTYGGGTPYQVTVKTFVPRIFIPMVVPGARVGVKIDPTDPQKVQVDFEHFGGNDADASTGDGAAAGAGSTAPGGMGFDFDAGGRPQSGEVAALVGAVNSGSLPIIKGSADELLATGTHGTAVITTAMPLGKTVRQINPSADPSRLDDPIWVFTVEVSLAGQNPFPAVFGHRVPIAKLASIGPGVKLAVAVGATDPHQDVAIDWDKSPIA
jgi:hypothetical protein